MSKKIKNSTAILIIIIVFLIGTSSLKIYYDHQDIEALESMFNHLETVNTTLTEEKRELESKLEETENNLFKLQYSPEELLQDIKNYYSYIEKNKEYSALTQANYRLLVNKSDMLHNAYTGSLADKEAQQLREQASNLINEYHKNEKKETTITYKPQVETIVYITNTGSKYHRNSCSYLRQSKIQIDESKAIRQGYTPCSRCNL